MGTAYVRYDSEFRDKYVVYFFGSVDVLTSFQDKRTLI